MELTIELTVRCCAQDVSARLSAPDRPPIHRPMERVKTLSVLQGGGVYVYNGRVTFTSTNIYDNDSSQAFLPPIPRPPWIFYHCPHELTVPRCAHREM